MSPSPSSDNVRAVSWRARLPAQWRQLLRAARALLRAVRLAVSGGAPAADRAAGRPEPVVPSPVPVVPSPVPGKYVAEPKARFTEGYFGQALRRRYMLYQPAFARPGPRPMLVLLHGCNQGAEDFAAGTRMNEAAESAGVVVLYPEQSVLANAMRCWNWYAPQDADSGVGDASIIAAMTRRIVSDHGIDPARIYVAGMSAGGAMAAVLARDYPDLYAALGVHSGVPPGLADDLFSALRLMRRGPAPGQVDAAQSGDDAVTPPVPSIVFHGEEDRTVHPSNAQAIHDAPVGDQTDQAPGGSLQLSTDSSEGHRGFTQSVDYGPDGVSRRELWIVHGAGHAWAGGSAGQRYTDADGPTASREMLRFFLQHRLGG